MRNILIIILSGLLFFSCEKNANIPMPPVDSQLVVAGFIAPNTDTLRLKLSWSLPIYNRNLGDYDDNLEPNASVQFINGSNTFTLEYDTLCKCYLAINTNFAIGDKVDLSIKYKDQKELICQSIIPAKPEYDIKYNGIKLIDYGDYTNSYAQFDFKCLANNAINYYRIKLLAYYSEDGISYKQEMYMYETEFLEMEPNTSILLNAYFPEYSVLDSVRYYIINCSEEYYKYHVSVRNYQGDDFFVEPSLIYDNIENGLGNFSSFNMESDTLITH